MTISVSTCLLQLGDAGLGDAHAPRALELERLGDDADGQDAELAGDARDDGGRARAGAAAHAGGDEHHVRAGDLGADLLDRLLGRGLADLGLGAGAEPFGQVDAELDAMLGARAEQRLRIGVGDDEIDAAQAGRDHVVDGVAAGAADADDGDARLQVGQLRQLQLDAHVPVPSSGLVMPHVRAHMPRCHRMLGLRDARLTARRDRDSELSRDPCLQADDSRRRPAMLQPIAPDIAEAAATTRPTAAAKRRAHASARAARHRGRLPEPHAAAERARQQLGQPDQLAGPARQHDTSGRRQPAAPLRSSRSRNDADMASTRRSMIVRSWALDAWLDVAPASPVERISEMARARRTVP